MSGSGNKQHGAEQACPEPGSKPVEGQRQEDHGEKQASEQQPACETGGQSHCEKREAESVRAADTSSSGKGEQSVYEKGARRSISDKEKFASEKGEQTVCEKGEQTVCEKGEQTVCEKGEQTMCEKEEQKSVCEKEEQKSVSQQKTPVSEQENPSEDERIDWRLKCDKAWKLSEDGIPTPEGLDWKDIYHKRPFGRNFLKSSNPEGLSTNEPPPPGPVDAPSPREPLESYGDFSGWKVSTENIPVDTSRIPPGVVVCYLPNYSWCIKEQLIDLVSEGLWAELLDSCPPEICVLDWYEDSKLHQFVYELHVKLLGADKSTVIQEFSLTPEDSMSGDSKGWKNVSHVFKAYGPGVRYVHFLHKSKDLFVVGFHRTRLTNTSVFVKLRE